MAIRKSTMQEQVGQAIAQLNPDDRAVVTVHSITGPSPWLMNSLGAIGQLFVKYYFVTVTEQAIVFHKAGRLSSRPKELAFSVPLAESGGLISDVQRNSMWSSFRFQIPGEEKPTRLNVARYWRAEMDQLLTALTGRSPAN